MNPPQAGLPSLAGLVRRHDPDRYFCALFAPATARETLFTLYAFNHELARACEVTREPGLALIRLQWWREVVEGAGRVHEVATPLRSALAGGALEAAPLLAMIEAREREAEGGFATLEAWCAWLEQGAGSLAVAAGLALRAPPAGLGRVRRLGAGYGAAGQVRNVAALARQGRCLLPADVLAAAGLSAEAVVAAPDSPALAGVGGVLDAAAARLLGRPERTGRGWIAAVLPAVLARRRRGAGDRAAVTAAYLAGRC